MKRDTPSLSGRAALRYSDIRFLLFSKVFGWISLHMVLVAIAYQVYDVTGDVMNLAYIGLATFAPAVGFALFTGYTADLFDRKLVMAICFGVILVSTFLFLFWSLGNKSEVWPVFCILFILGTGRAFYQPASNSLVPNLVPPEIFPNAVAWHTSTNKVAQMAGPAIGGMILTCMIKTKTKKISKEPTNLRVLLAGLSYVYNKKIVFGAITVDLFVVLCASVTALLPVFAKDILEVGPSGAGFLRSAIAFGSLPTALLLTQITIDRAVGKILFISIYVFGAATILFGLSQLYWLSLLSMVIIGVGDMVSVYIRHTLIQIATPDDMRGRVSAVDSVFTGASNEIGEFRAGLMAAMIGAVPAVLLGGLGCFFITAVCWKIFPELTKVERMDRNL